MMLVFQKKKNQTGITNSFYDNNKASNRNVLSPKIKKPTQIVSLFEYKFNSGKIVSFVKHFFPLKIRLFMVIKARL